VRVVSLHRRNPRRDTAEAPIVKRLRQLGADVYHLSARGIPDPLKTIDLTGRRHGL
jgi:hypothetical protein